MNFVLAVTVLIKEIRTILGIKADNVEMWSLEENKEIKENDQTLSQRIHRTH
ncbi:16708_t:CDS:2 [Entrophospora sp. SA101]|nr:16708_t:CDS:2 [Entrophospora sp. SA101]